MAADPELLRDIALFQTLDDGERTAVAELMQETCFAAGTTLFREHDQGGVMYAIQRGRIELWVTDEDRSKVVVDILEPGEFFGQLDYQVNVKAEFGIQRLHDRLDTLEQKFDRQAEELQQRQPGQ
jgi:signal-transduction protein with cAMP-binding, CBS, and nucleotidyltransferase domain